MKKSELYYLAQIAVVESPSFDAETILAILPELMDAEKLARFGEEQVKKEKQVVANNA